MSNNKVAMALVLGAVSAVVAAPMLLNKEAEKNKDLASGSTVADNDLIDLKNNLDINLPEAERIALETEVGELLKRNVSTEDLMSGLSLVLKGYGEGGKSLENEVYEELSLAMYSSDSTNVTNYAVPNTGSPYAASVMFCHAACHSACHSACHGSRGWR